MSSALCVSGFAVAQVVTTRESVDSSGMEGDAGSIHPALSANGRYVAFLSAASNLVSGDTNGVQDIFVRDRQNGETALVSIHSDGAQADDSSSCLNTAISADGRFVAFTSLATNLVVGDTNQVQDVFVHDSMSGTTTRVSVGPAGAQGDDTSGWASISDDARYVAFLSNAGNLVPGHAGGTWHVFVRDLQAGVTTLATESSLGVKANANSINCVISGDGHSVAFQSDADNLVPGDTNGTSDVFVRNFVTGTISRVSVGTLGVEGNDASGYPSLSFDGRYVAFHSRASNFIAGDSNVTSDVFVRDLLNGTTVRANVDSIGAQANGYSGDPSLSADGRRVAFRSFADNLDAGDTNTACDTFVHDLETGVTARISKGPGGAQVQGLSTQVSISDSGRFIAYASDAPDLVAADHNGAYDVFVIDTGVPPITSYCTAGTTTNGCVPTISGLGSPSASAGSGFTITVQQVEGLKQGIVFYGINNFGFAPQSWGASTSWLCVKSPLQRTSSQNSGGSINQCDGALSVDFNSFIAAHPTAVGQPFTFGQQTFAQAWFRDPPSPKTTMLSDALRFFVEP